MNQSLNIYDSYIFVNNVIATVILDWRHNDPFAVIKLNIFQFELTRCTYFYADKSESILSPGLLLQETGKLVGLSVLERGHPLTQFSAY